MSCLILVFGDDASAYMLGFRNLYGDFALIQVRNEHAATVLLVQLQSFLLDVFVDTPPFLNGAYHTAYEVIRQRHCA